MREFQQQRILRHLIYSKFSIFLLFAVFLFFAFSTIGIYKKKREAAQKNNDVEKELNDLMAKKDYLEAKVNRLDTGTGVEEELRDKFQIAMPGEEVLIIVDESGKGADKESAIETEDKSWFFRLFGF